MNRSLIFLQSQFGKSGFYGYASPSCAPFKPQRRQSTIFPSILILEALQLVPESQAVRSALAAYIRSQTTAGGIWNYWQRGSASAAAEPYPDDLDDTACAIAALTPYGLDPDTLGNFARALVSTETKPGGPYNDWVIDTEAAPQWRHVDLGVNANIGYALSLHDTQLAGLTAYVTEQLRAGRLRSAYYVGELPVVYFLSRWYRGAACDVLRAAVRQKLRRIDNLSSLEQALLLTSAIRLRTDQPLEQLARQLSATASDGSWPAAALYIDPVYNGKQHYGGSAAVTTALALEALQLYETYRTTAVATPRRRLPALAEHEANSIVSPLLRQRYRRAIRQLFGRGSGGQIIRVADNFRQTTMPVALHVRRRLNAASLNGWLAYTTYDSLCDGEPTTAVDLIMANVALRRSLDHYRSALPADVAFQAIVSQAFDSMDAANAWEVSHARAQVSKSGRVHISRLPDYENYQQLASRSLGHSLAGVGMVQAAGLDCLPALQQFYHHFLIARQLSDDAHDWEDDLRRGHLTAVVCLLLAGRPLPQRLHPDRLDQLRLHFWEDTIDEAVRLIRHHCTLAGHHLDSCTHLLDVTPQRRWLDQLERAADQAITVRNETLQFMQAFQRAA